MASRRDLGSRSRARDGDRGRRAPADGAARPAAPDGNGGPGPNGVIDACSGVSATRASDGHDAIGHSSTAGGYDRADRDVGAADGHGQTDPRPTDSDRVSAHRGSAGTGPDLRVAA